MKTIIDAYNLYHYARRQDDSSPSLAVSGLISAVAKWARISKDDTLLVFDGNRPAEVDVSRSPGRGFAVQFVGPGRTADDVIIDFITTYSAPRTLLIVSTDREIRREAKKRRCKVLSCKDFWADVVKMLSRRPPVREPREKRTGLTGDQVDYWLDEFGME